jgi:1,4-alpha-glucan branching enzyme
MLRKRRRNEDGRVRVTFELPAEAGGEVVHLVGDFTDWQGQAMKRGKDGSWTTSVDLEPGRSYQFRYLVDGERWENDWQADRYVPGPFGSENSVVETPSLKTQSRGSSTGRRRGPGKPRTDGARGAAGEPSGD